jgi:hypothetical protein
MQVGIEQSDARAVLVQGECQVHRYRGLADAPLPTGYGEDMRNAWDA